MYEVLVIGGGPWMNDGRVPTRVLAQAAELHRDARHAPSYWIELAGPPDLDVAKPVRSRASGQSHSVTGAGAQASVPYVDSAYERQECKREGNVFHYRHEPCGSPCRNRWRAFRMTRGLRHGAAARIDMPTILLFAFHAVYTHRSGVDMLSTQQVIHERQHSDRAAHETVFETRRAIAVGRKARTQVNPSTPMLHRHEGRRTAAAPIGVYAAAAHVARLCMFGHEIL
jgi:hypothetical protein